MLTVEWEVGLLVMVEDDFWPALRVMAAVALLTEFTTMYVLNLVAAYTGLRCVLVLLVKVAGVTACIAVAELEREVGLVMIEIGFLPAVSVMAVAAFFTLFPFVYIDLLMTAVTICRRFGMFLFLKVACITAGLLMRTF